MKKCILPKVVLLFYLFSFGAITLQGTTLTPTDALDSAKKLFTGKPADYYSSDSPTADSLIIFVDAQPSMNWEHECYVLKYPKQFEGAVESISPEVTRQNLPPEFPDGLSPLEVSFNQFPLQQDPMIIEESPVPFTSHVSHRTCCKTHALILSGGIDPSWNYYRYWNDCAFIYQTLSKHYLIHKENIHVHIADGGIQYGSTITIPEGQDEAVPNDIDGDGETDRIDPASYSLINNLFHNLDITLKELDHLFIYVIDHGGRDEDGESYINLWNNEKIYAFDLIRWPEPLIKRNVFVTIVMGQCYSGGFVEHLKHLPNISIATACAPDETSGVYMDFTKPLGDVLFKYDEFVYHWTCAMNGATPYGTEVNADSDNDGNVSIEEAFIYAQQKDRLKTETPQYYTSSPLLTNYLSFYRIPYTTNFEELYSNYSSEELQFSLANRDLIVSRSINNTSDFEISIVSCLDYKTVYMQSFSADNNSVTIPTSQLPEGIYIALACNKSGAKITYKFSNVK